MPHTRRRVRRSIFTRLLLVGVFILFAIGGMVLVNTLSFRQVETLMTTTITSKISNVIENARLGRELNQIFGDTNLLISTFMQREGLLETEGVRLLDELNQTLNTASLNDSLALQSSLQYFTQSLQALLTQCMHVVNTLQELAHIEQDIETKLTTLEDLLSEKVLMVAIEGNEEESFMVEQMMSITPEYHHILSQVKVLLIQSRQAHLGIHAVEVHYEEEIMQLLDDLHAGLTVVVTSGQEFTGLGKELIASVLTYQDTSARFHQEMERFQMLFQQLNDAENQVVGVMEEVDDSISQAATEIQSEVLETTASSKTLMLVFSFGVLGILLFAGYYMLRTIRPITHLANTAARLATGDITSEFQEINSDDEIGLLTHAFRDMVHYFQNVAAVAEKIAEGNVQVQVFPQSERDVLNNALQNMLHYIQDVADITERISEQDLTVTVKPRSKRDVLNTSLQKMISNLQRFRAADMQRNWMKDGITQLGVVLSGETSLAQVSQKAISFLARYLQAGSGVLYSYDAEQQCLTRHGTFAFTEDEAPTRQYELGEGVIGQVALERKTLHLTQPTEDVRNIETGTFAGPPMHTYTMPIVYDDTLYGVLELASFEAFTEERQRFLQEANRVIATALFSAIQREQGHRLLTRSQRAAQEAEQTKQDAQQQAEEARQVSVRLEEQQQQLLQQNEEFRQMNAQLQTHRQQLEEAEESLKASEALNTAILDTAFDGIITIDEQGIIHTFNPAAARLFGYTPDEVVGKNVNLLMPSPHQEQHSRYIANYLQTGKAKIIGVGREVQGRHKDGHLFPFHLAVSEIRVSERRMFTGIIHDLSPEGIQS